MEPRLASSQKWAKFPKDINDLILQVMSQDFAEFEEKGSFHVDGRIFPEEITLQIGFLPKDRLKQNNFESSIDYKSGKDDTIQAIQTLMQASFSMMQTYFDAEASDESVDYPQEWQDYDFDDTQVFLKYTTNNTNLETEADKLLGEYDDALIGQTTESAVEDILDQVGIGDAYKKTASSEDSGNGSSGLGAGQNGTSGKQFH